jgi:uncharacterized protein with FMN-binding domain
LPRKTISTLAAAWLLAFPPLSAWAAVQSPKTATPKKKVVTTTTATVTGPSVPCKRWGPLQVRIKVKKTTTTIGTTKKVKIKILAIDFPIVSDATFKTRYINQQALPLLVEDTLQLQNATVEVISGATDTTISFKQSLQAAILQAKK